MLKRWQNTLTAVMQSRFARVVLAVFAGVATWDTLGSQLMPPGVREKWPTAYDVVAKTTGYFPFWVWVLVGAAILIAFTLNYAHRKRGGDTFYSPTVGQTPSTPEQVSAARSAPLREMRKAGVALRNMHVNNEAKFAYWRLRYARWREATLSAAATLSPVLHDRLETLNEMHGIPGNVHVFSAEHGHSLTIMSEILRRIERWLEDHE